MVAASFWSPHLFPKRTLVPHASFKKGKVSTEQLMGVGGGLVRKGIRGSRHVHLVPPQAPFSIRVRHVRLADKSCGRTLQKPALVCQSRPPGASGPDSPGGT